MSSDVVSAGKHLVAGFHHRNTLPHLKREGGTYFVTFRQEGTLPADLIERLKRERELILKQAVAASRPLTWLEQEELFRWYSSRVDSYLDHGHGECFLKDREVADMVVNSLRHFDGSRYHLRSWVIMPNHVHVVVQPLASYTLSEILHSWKSFTANGINRLLRRTGRFWQKESYDHLITDHCIK